MKNRRTPAQTHTDLGSAFGEETATVSSGNVFADLGFENPREEALKSNIVIQIGRCMKRLALSQAKTATLLHISQPDVSRLLRGQTDGYSVERLLGFVNALGTDADIVFKTPEVERPARTRVLLHETA